MAEYPRFRVRRRPRRRPPNHLLTVEDPEILERQLNPPHPEDADLDDPDIDRLLERDYESDSSNSNLSAPSVILTGVDFKFRFIDTENKQEKIENDSQDTIIVSEKSEPEETDTLSTESSDVEIVSIDNSQHDSKKKNNMPHM